MSRLLNEISTQATENQKVNLWNRATKVFQTNASARHVLDCYRCREEGDAPRILPLYIVGPILQTLLAHCEELIEKTAILEQSSGRVSAVEQLIMNVRGLEEGAVLFSNGAGISPVEEYLISVSKGILKECLLDKGEEGVERAFLEERIRGSLYLDVLQYTILLDDIVKYRTSLLYEKLSKLPTVMVLDNSDGMLGV